MANYFEDNTYFEKPFFTTAYFQQNPFFQGTFFGTAFNPPPLVAKRTRKPRKPKVETTEAE